jgi:ATP-dependent RNA helicase SUPV3L1/SUV3
VRIGAFSLHLPALLAEAPQALAAALNAGDEPLRAGALVRLSGPAPGPRALSARGLLAVGGLAVPVADLENLDEALRAASRPGRTVALTDPAREALGWSVEQATTILRGLGYTPARKAVGDEPAHWRRRGIAKPAPVAEAVKDSPFSALSSLALPPPAAPRQNRRPRRAKRKAGA